MTLITEAWIDLHDPALACELRDLVRARAELMDIVDAVIAGPLVHRALSDSLHAAVTERNEARAAVATTLAAADAAVAGLAAAGDRLSAEHELWRPVVDLAKCWRNGFRGDRATELCNAIDTLLDAEAKR